MKQLTIRSVLALTALAVAALTLIPAALGRTDRQATMSTTIHVSGGEFFFKLSTKTIPTPGNVTFVFKNVGHILHDFEIAGRATPLIEPGKTAKLTVTFRKQGRYPYLCTAPGHASAGMKGVFTVR